MFTSYLWLVLFSEKCDWPIMKCCLIVGWSPCFSYDKNIWHKHFNTHMNSIIFKMERHISLLSSLETYIFFLEIHKSTDLKCTREAAPEAVLFNRPTFTAVYLGLTDANSCTIPVRCPLVLMLLFASPVWRIISSVKDVATAEAVV